MKTHRGFTLIELLVVIAIIGVLSSVILASLNTARAKGRDAQRKSEMLELQKALEMYYADRGTYPVAGAWSGYGNGACGTGAQGTLSGATGYVPNLAPTYIPVLPVDPNFANANCTGYIYFSDGTNYALLDHALPEQFPSSGQALYDPVRPNWAYKICAGAGCGW